MKVIKIPIEIAEPCTVHDVNQDNCLNEIKELLNIEWAEIVVTHIRSKDLHRDFCLIVDEVGKLKENCRVNFRASMFYAGTPHGDPIVGNVILCAREWTDSFGECDLAGLEGHEIEQIMQYL